MEIPELVSLLKTKIDLKIEDFAKLEKEKVVVQGELLASLKLLEEIVKANYSLMNDQKVISTITAAYEKQEPRKDSKERG
jgi:uncharacterized Zn finger protein